MKKRLLNILLMCCMVLTMLLVTAPEAAADDGQSLGTIGQTCPECKTVQTLEIIGYIGKREGYQLSEEQHWLHVLCPSCGKEGYLWGEDHIGGTQTPTCTTGKTCEKCGVEYGILGHDWGEWKSNGDNKTHIRTCKRDGCTAFETEGCGGDGSANCVTMGTCTVCGGQYNGGHYFAKPYTYGYDENTHWHACSYCEEGKEAEGAHFFIQGNMHLKSAATCISKTVYYTNCTICLYKGTDTYVYEWSQLDPNNHEGGTEVRNVKAATCTEKGYTGDTYCKGCGVKLTDGTEIPALDHDWDTTYTWTQTETGYTCTAKRVCKNDAAHTESKTVTASYSVVTNPTCLADGIGRYQASFEADWAEPASKDVSIPATGHDWDKWQSNGDGTHTRVCKSDDTHTETKDCSGGTATCTEEATCTDCGKAYGEKDSANHTGKEEWTITKTKHVKKWSCCGEVTVAEKSHTFGKWVVTKNATSKQDGEKTRTCKVCEYVEKATIQATGAPAKTGDESHIGMWAGILCVSLAGIIALVVLYKKKHKK